MGYEKIRFRVVFFENNYLTMFNFNRWASPEKQTKKKKRELNKLKTEKKNINVLKLAMFTIDIRCTI